MDNAAAHVKAACRSSLDKSIDRTMKKPEPKPTDERAARLAQALRANLHRRKAQARGLDDGNASEGEPDEGPEKPGQ